LPLGLFQSLLSLDGFLSLDLFVVELSEVVDDDGNGEGHDQDAADGATGADDLAEARYRGDVSIPYCRHGNDGPPVQELQYNQTRL